MKESLVSTRTLREGLAALDEQRRADAPFMPEYITKREERMILEFRRLIREAEVEYVSSGAAEDLTGWNAATLRRYARLALAGDPMPEEWSRLVVKREGKEFAFVLSTIPPKAKLSAA
jgi:hypothetical protein